MQTNNPAPVRVFSRQFCEDCISVHWMEEVTKNRVVCHGRHFIPRDSQTHFTRWYAGTIELVEKAHTAPDIVTDWMFAEVEERDPDWLDLGI